MGQQSVSMPPSLIAARTHSKQQNDNVIAATVQEKYANQMRIRKNREAVLNSLKYDKYNLPQAGLSRTNSTASKKTVPMGLKAPSLSCNVQPHFQAGHMKWTISL